MTAPTPEDVALTLAETITGSAEAHPGVVAIILAAIRKASAQAVMADRIERDKSASRIVAAIRAARAAAIEEAARVADERAGIEYEAGYDRLVDMLRDTAAAIRALGEESAAPREEATS